MGLFAVWLWFAAVFSVLALGLLLSALTSGEPPRRAFRRRLDRMLDIMSFGVAISIIP
jgi:heme exporter protein D